MSPVLLTLNGEEKSIPQPLSLTALLAHFQIATQGVAVELSGRIVPRDAWETTQVEEGAVVELVRFVGGG